MDLPDLKHLDKIIALCRKRGVKNVKIGDIELTLSDSTPTVSKSNKAQTPTNSPFETDSLSEEELLMWSVGSERQHAALG